MSVAPAPDLFLHADFATAFPELSIPWTAETAPEPRLLVLNEPLAADLGLDRDDLRTPDGVRMLIGNVVPSAATPVAQGYAGHQFGGFSPRLGDGRALLLGELVAPDGSLRDLHLKGSGRTPFSRGGDGRAVVGPMLREYVVSEAMHALGIPTTRSLAVVATGRVVQRDLPLPGAVLARVAASHLRVGSFQFARGTGDLALVRRLADAAIARHHPTTAAARNPYLALFDAVVAVQASLVARWMLVGFVHGVMNTDNMTISGETIDYGPCAFLDVFDPAASFSSIDTGGRYAFRNQPVVAEWNLARLAEAMLELFADDAADSDAADSDAADTDAADTDAADTDAADTDAAVALAVASLGRFRERYSAVWSAGMREKLGLATGLAEDETAPLVDALFSQLQQSRVDHTWFFRRLSDAARGDAEPVRGLFLDLAAFDEWLDRWRALRPDADLMDRTNPVYIPRNHLVEEALDAATGGDLDPLHTLLDAVTRPFDERPGLERYAAAAPMSPDYRTFCGT